jgi:fimbrial isopeptide formation D2 family protein
MAQLPIGAINRSKWVLIALVFLIAQIIPIIQFNGVANAADTGTPKTPGATNSPNNWDTNTVGNIQSSNDSYVSDNDGDEQGYTSFNLPVIPAGSSIDGIAVNIEAKSSDRNGCRVGVALSWNNGSNWTSYQTQNLDDSDSSYLIGENTDDWGRVWLPSEFTNTNFVVKIQDQDSQNNCTDSATTSVDYLDVKIYYTAPLVIVNNPTLATACGLDISLVVDNSTSIDSGEMTQMKTALKAFTSALDGTPTEFSVTKFASSASVEQAFTNDITAVNAAIDGVPTGGGFTNWEDGLSTANGTFPNRAGNPDLIVFATDGDPTTSNTVGGTDTNQPNAHLAPAVTVANTIKTSNKRILSIGIGLGGSSLTRLQQISGPITDNGNILTSDVITSDFSTLAADLAEFASQTCGGTITTTKLIDADGNLQTTQDQTPAANWTFDIYGGSNPAATQTDAQGITPAVEVDPATGYSVTESQQNGYVLLDAVCDGATVNGIKNGNAVTGMQIDANDIVSCTFINTPSRGTLNVNKVVQNNHGGTKTPSNFSFTVNNVSYPFESDGTNSVTLPAGTYTITEDQADSDGYSTEYSNCTQVVVVHNQSATCTITNSDTAPKLIVKKHVINNNGGLLNASDFTMNVTGTNVSDNSFAGDENGVEITLNAGAYSVDESTNNDYAKTIGENCVGTIALGETKTCIITNDDKQPSLTLTKYVTTDNGGNAIPTNWTLTADGPTPVSGLGGSTSDANFNAGTYTLSETGGPVGYAPQGWICEGGQQNGNQITVGLGQNVSCTITNDDEAPVLVLLKNLNPELFGSNAGIGNFTLKAKDSNNSEAISNTSGNANSGADFQSGEYTLSETSSFNANTYEASDWSCLINGSNTPTILVGGVINLGLADNAVCTITNEMKPATLIVEKVVKNDNGGKAKVTDYSYKINQGSSTYFDADGSVTNQLNKGTYTVVEDQANANGYETSYSDDCTDVFIDNGETKTCTITNDDISPKLTLTKITPNDNGGDLDPSQVALFATGPSPAITATQFTSGDTKDLSAGSYVISETPVPGYEASKWTGDCASDGSLTMVPGGTYSCSITNDDLPNTLTVNKIVKNDNGGTMTAGQFSFSVNSGSSVAFDQDALDELLGKNELSLNSGTYSVSEPNVPSGYDVSYDGCTNIVFTLDQNATCTITNDDKPATVVVHKTVINDDGGTKQSSNFTMYVEGTNVSNTGFAGDANGTSVTLDAGSYSVGEDQLYGYKMTTMGNCSGTIANGETKHCYVINDDIAPKLTIYKSIPDDYPTDQEFEFDVTKSCICPADNEISCECSDKAIVNEVDADNGYYQTFEVTNLSAGTWNVEEEVPTGWELIGYYCMPVYGYEFNPLSVMIDENSDTDEGTKVRLGIGDEYVCYFYNQPLSTVTVTKYHDKNENGVRDDYFGTEEPLLEGFTFNLYTEEYNYEDGWEVVLVDSDVSDENGNVTFENVPSNFYWIEEVEQEGWKLTSLVCEGDPDPKYDDIRLLDSEYQDENENDFYVEPGSQADCYAGNASTKYYYDIAKSNNAPTAKRVGDIVTYTITLTIPEDTGVLYNPRVGDVTPKGFTYLNGSWTANSNLRGNLKPGVSVEPTYASPGVWRFNGFDFYYDEEETITNNAFYPGEVITLTYLAKIQSGVTAGTYPDVALSFAFTTSNEEDQTRDTAVLANVTGQDGTTPFVSSDVTVVVDAPAPTLVNTGSNALWALLMGAALIIGGYSTRRITASERRMK